jgi:hypothetical protein
MATKMSRFDSQRLDTVSGIPLARPDTVDSHGSPACHRRPRGGQVRPWRSTQACRWAQPRRGCRGVRRFAGGDLAMGSRPTQSSRQSSSSLRGATPAARAPRCGGGDRPVRKSKAARQGRPASNSSPSPSTIPPAFLDAADERRRCRRQGCTNLLRPGQEKWCSDGCRQGAYRDREALKWERALRLRYLKALRLRRQHALGPIEALTEVVAPSQALREISRLAAEKAAA